MQNLQVTLDITEIGNAIRANVIKPFTKQNGHMIVTFDVLVNKDMAVDQYGNTHNVTVSYKKEDGTWDKARGAEGKVVYFGNARPSKFQPTADAATAQQSAATQQSTNNTTDLPF